MPTAMTQRRPSRCLSPLVRRSVDNAGEIMGRPATGRHARVMITIPDRHADGKIAESWAIWDTLGMLQQLGLVPSSSGAQQPA
ncbi:ester cyclase [Mycolicibacterium smegmatis]|nr:ester cyclase [Mycolicibacterium smegmatis]ULN69150.1 ester cyclase [Mycolicibacterium smegmatis]